MKVSTVGLPGMEVPLALLSMFWGSIYPQCSATAALEVRLRDEQSSGEIAGAPYAANKTSPVLSIARPSAKYRSF